MSQLPYDTFRETLANKYPNCGHALWEPSPGGLYDSVEVGDVGFIRQGCFHRLFNVLLPGNHPSHQNFGVPEHHQQLRLNAPNHIHRGMEGTDDFCSRHVSLSRGRNIHALGPDDDHQVTVSCPGRRGAMLSLPFPAQRDDTVALGDFGRWIVKHIDVWFAFAENLGLGITRMQDIVLVTGRHCAKSWVNVAFSDGQRDAEVSFGAQPSGVSGVNIERRLVRGDVVLKLGPSGENLPENQCIFIRGFRVVRIMKIWPRLRGRAGPAPDVGRHESEPEPDKQLEVIGTNTDTIDQDPLHVLLQYIAERAPDCDMVLAHDDDLACIDGVPLDSFQPDVLLEHLRDSVPEIRQVQWSNESRSGAEAAITKIATLSTGAFTIEQSMAVTNERPMRIGDMRAPSPLTASEVPKRSMAGTTKNLFDYAPKAASAGNSTGLCDAEEDGDYLVWTFPEAAPTAKRDCGGVRGNTDTSWGGYDAPGWDASANINTKDGEEWVCPEHGAMCNPGICKARAGVGSNRRREAKKREKWKEPEKKERKLARAEGRDISSHGLPPHPAGYTYRGAGSSSKSKDDGPQDLGVGFQHSGSSAVGAEERLHGELQLELDASADDKNEWVDEDVGIGGVTDDLLQLEFHPDYVANPENRRRRWKVRWEALLRSFHALDRETDTTLVLLAAPSHTGRLHSVASRAIRRDVELLDSSNMKTIRSASSDMTNIRSASSDMTTIRPASSDMTAIHPASSDMKTIRSAFAEVAARRRASRSASLLEQISRASEPSSSRTSGSSEARKKDLRRALDTVAGSLSALGSLYEQREKRWIEEKHRLDEDREKVQLLLKQVLGVGVVGNLVDIAI